MNLPRETAEEILLRGEGMIVLLGIRPCLKTIP